MRNLYGADRYELATTHKRLAVDSARCHSWPEKDRASHSDTFQNIRPGLVNTFEKPKTAGRKPLFKIKQKTLVPEIVEECLETSSKRQARDNKKKFDSNASSQAIESAHSGETSSLTQLSSQNNIHFSGTRRKVKNVFE